MLIKLAKIRINDFKSLLDLELDFTGSLKVLVGQNGAGKSSILQAIDFMRYFAEGRPEDFFSDRQWSTTHVKSFFSPRNTISIECVFNTDNSSVLSWRFSWGLNTKRSVRERVILCDRNQKRTLLSYDREPDGLLTVGRKKIATKFRFTGSVLAQLDFDPDLDTRSRQYLAALRKWIQGILSLELLSPAAMRLGSRGSKDFIGQRGQFLASYLGKLKSNQKAQVARRLAGYYPPLRQLETTKKRAGWIALKVDEAYKSGRSLDSIGLSDGFLRLLAIALIPEFSQNASIVLLDEVENGIDTHVLPKIVSDLSDIGGVDILLTSHSPHFINLVDRGQVDLVVRRRSGSSVAVPISKIPELRKEFEFFGPGEIWGNFSGTRIFELALRATQRTQKPVRRLVKPRNNQ